MWGDATKTAFEDRVPAASGVNRTSQTALVTRETSSNDDALMTPLVHPGFDIELIARFE